MKNLLIEWVAFRLPRRVLYWAVVRAWAIATTTVYQDRTPDEVKWYQVLEVLEKGESIGPAPREELRAEEGERERIKNLPAWQLRTPDGSRDEPMISRREVLEILYPIIETN